MANKILNKNENERKKKPIEEFEEILSIDKMMTVLSIFYIGCSAAVVLVKTLAKDNFWLWMGVVGIIVFILLWITFQVLALRQRRKNAENARINETIEIAKQLEFCRDCSLKKIRNGMEYRKIYLHQEIKEIEEKLNQDINPTKVNVLVYTSDLSTIIRRMDVMKNNIDRGIRYKVLYFRNTTGSKYNEIKELLDDNLIDALSIEDISSSLDAEMMMFNDMEVLIYLDSTRRFIQGFFSIDNVSNFALESGRNTHDSECKEKCNYGKEHQEPTYKALNDEKAKMLFLDIEKLTKEVKLHE